MAATVVRVARATAAPGATDAEGREGTAVSAARGARVTLATGTDPIGARPLTWAGGDGTTVSAGLDAPGGARGRMVVVGCARP